MLDNIIPSNFSIDEEKIENLDLQILKIATKSHEIFTLGREKDDFRFLFFQLFQGFPEYSKYPGKNVFSCLWPPCVL